MRALLQRVDGASVEVGGRTVGAVGRGFLVLLGVERGDGEREADALAERVATLRVFDDPQGKMNLALREVGGGILLVPQFTLCADTRSGRRPSFDAAAPPDAARALVERFGARLRALGLEVASGSFGEAMRVHLVNDGPATFLLEAKPGAA
ncbi:MAG TPA: D-aminoacyl-tRNA deacylase [Planctomycetota bacterium]|jgi:D-tyrosyl-tRNA(Tyr) deacylase|nr:D-aminoacyl-tRNA deacylase [Planctomycetota bacterium]